MSSVLRRTIAALSSGVVAGPAKPLNRYSNSDLALEYMKLFFIEVPFSAYEWFDPLSSPQFTCASEVVASCTFGERPSSTSMDGPGCFPVFVVPHRPYVLWCPAWVPNTPESSPR